MRTTSTLQWGTLTRGLMVFLPPDGVMDTQIIKAEFNLCTGFSFLRNEDEEIFNATCRTPREFDCYLTWLSSLAKGKVAPLRIERFSPEFEDQNISGDHAGDPWLYDATCIAWDACELADGTILLGTADPMFEQPFARLTRLQILHLEMALRPIWKQWATGTLTIFSETFES